MGVSATYTQTATVNLPLTASLGAGTYYILVQADAQSRQPENNENNNFKSESLAISLPPVPDLIVSQIDAPIEAVGGRTIQFSWTVTNQGTGPATGTWYDRVLLSTDTAVGDDLLLGNFTFTGTIEPGESMTRTQSYTLPVSFEGNRWFIVQADQGNNLYEHANDGNNTRVDDAPIYIQRDTTLPIVLSHTPASAVNAPVDHVDVTFSEEIHTGLVNLSQFVLTGPDQQPVGSPGFAFFSIGGNTYRVTFAPQSVDGDYKLILPASLTDLAGNQMGSPYEAGFQLAVPDLSVSSAVVTPSTAYFGDSIQVAWNVVNVGPSGATANGQWSDEVWLSSDAILDDGPGGDLRLGSTSVLGPLESAGSYSHNIAFTIPSNQGLPEGDYYILVRTDAGTVVFENVESNNVLAATATVNLTTNPHPARTWIASAGGDWHNAANWQGGQIPLPNEIAVIDVPGITVTHSFTGSTIVTGLFSSANLQLTGGTFTVTGSGVVEGALTVGGSAALRVDGSNASFIANGATTVDSGSLYALHGGHLALPNLTSYYGGTTGHSYLEASGTGSLLDLTSVTSLSSNPAGNWTYLRSLAGGQVLMPQVSTITQGYCFELRAEGDGSLLDLSSLTTIAASRADITASSGGAIDASLATLRRVNWHLYTTGTIDTSLVSEFSEGTLRVHGGNPDFDNLRDITGASLIVDAGGQLIIPPELTNFHGGTQGHSYLEASGTGSLLDLTSVTSLSSNPAGNWTYLRSLAGGQVLMPQVSTITQGYCFELRAEGDGSLLDLSSLTTIAASRADITASSGGAIDASLATLRRVNWHLYTTGTIDTSLVSEFSEGTLRVHGGNPDFDNLRDITGASLIVDAGGQLIIPPELTNFHGGTRGHSYLEASGTGSLLDLTSVTSLSSNPAGNWTYLRSLAGGQVLMPQVSTITQGYCFELRAEGDGSLLDLSSLTTIAASRADITASSGGTIDASLATLRRVNWHLYTTGTIDTSLVSEFSEGTLRVHGGNPDFDNLRDITGASLIVDAGGQLIIPPELTNFHGGTRGHSYLEASGTGSLLDLTSVTSLSSNPAGNWTYLRSLAGGQVLMPQVSTITQGYCFELRAEGDGSLLDLSSLTTIAASRADITASSGGAIDASLATLRRVNWHLYTTGTIDTSLVSEFSEGTLRVHGGNPDFDNLRDITGASLIVDAGGQLIIPPELTNFHGGTRGHSYLEASGTGSLLDLTSVTSLSSNPAGTWTYLRSLAGGQVLMPQVSTITQGYRFDLRSDGAGSFLDLSGLTSIDVGHNTSFVVTNGATAALGTWTSMDNVTMQLGAGSAIWAGTLELLHSSSLNGKGELVGNLVNRGTVTVGLAPAGFAIEGDFVQSLLGTTVVEVGGSLPNSYYSQLRVSGTAALGGTLEIQLGIVPDVWTDFPILQAESVAGHFSTVTGGQLRGYLLAHYGSATVALSRNFDGERCRIPVRQLRPRSAGVLRRAAGGVARRGVPRLRSRRRSGLRELRHAA